MHLAYVNRKAAASACSQRVHWGSHGRGGMRSGPHEPNEAIARLGHFSWSIRLKGKRRGLESALYTKSKGEFREATATWSVVIRISRGGPRWRK
jgi:hypothetical protein